MNGIIYDKIEIIERVLGNGGGKLMKEFTDVRYSLIGNSLIIHKTNTGKGEISQTNDVFSLDNIIKFKCTEKC